MKKHFVRTLLLVITIIIAGCAGGGGETVTNNGNATNSSSVTLSWTSPATRADGTYLGMSEIAGYKVYIGSSAADLTYLADIADPYTMEYAIDDLETGTYYFAISTYDSNGMESDYSGVVSKTI